LRTVKKSIIYIDVLKKISYALEYLEFDEILKNSRNGDSDLFEKKTTNN